MNKTVLFAWELGSGGGHVGNLVPVARELAIHGYRPVFVLRNVTGHYPSLESAGFPILQAPQWPTSVTGKWRASSYADILAVHGYGSVEGLSRLVKAWEGLFQVTTPALIVADHSPTVCLAARDIIPAILLGNGFTLPPAYLPTFPPLRLRASRTRTRETMPQERVLGVIRQVQHIHHRSAPDTLPALLDTAKRFVFSLPELDPYRALRREPLFFPFDCATRALPLPTAPSLYAYCSDKHPELEAIAHALAGLEAPVSAYFREERKVLSRFLEGLGIHVHSNPPPYDEALSQASAVLSQAGQATAHSALITGRPQILSPIHLEAKLTSQALVELGVGIEIQRPIKIRRLRKILKKVLEDKAMAERAMALAHTIAARERTDSLSAVVSACRTLAA
uniref:UDP:flavonoid glycosyltransferase YjiC, YdhE family n=1 Tax=Candidatus Kentrum sp. FW TaxID=2126338 RepID=A0A450TKC6_9GAMM|nr:MAG: UDP:flavonoid glycosyltransferase YjiC, YdhE family [Candidatus Kentron sp. FW]